MKFPCRTTLLAPFAAAVALAAPVRAADPVVYIPFPQLPAPELDEAHNGLGIAQQTARGKKMQARMLWVDATANLTRINTTAKIAALCARIKKAGFNTVVLDVKPLSGSVMYPSRYAPRLTDWRGLTFPGKFDPVAAFVKESHAQGLQIVASLNAFCEGHAMFKEGLAYLEHADWQTVLYDARYEMVSGATGTSCRVAKTPNRPAPDTETLAVYTTARNIPGGHGYVVAILTPAGKVAAVTGRSGLSSVRRLWGRGGTAVVGDGAAGEYLRKNAVVGEALTFVTTPEYVAIGERPDAQLPLMVNPHDRQVRQRLLDMLAELMAAYPLDGVVFDDRFRYASVNADFSLSTRLAFENYLGKPVYWPNDVMHWEVKYPTLSRRLIRGRYYQEWLTFRAKTLHDWLAEAVQTVKYVRPAATFGVYVGSWYGDSALYGVNWAAPDFAAPFRFLTPAYKETGFANLVDWVVTGCYYDVPTIADARSLGLKPGATVEAAGQLSNRVVNDAAWVYAGVMLQTFQNNPERLKKALQAAAASTQGVMVFDLSHNMESFWSVFEEAFREPCLAPHTQPALLTEVRRMRAARKAQGIPDPPVTVLQGVSGTGF